MIIKNGIRAFSHSSYDYYELKKDFGFLKKGAIFVHDPEDNMYGSLVEGCLKLCWTENGDCFNGICANTVFLHFKFAKDDIFERVYADPSQTEKEKLKTRLKELEKEVKEIRDSIK